MTESASSSGELDKNFSSAHDRIDNRPRPSQGYTRPVMIVPEIVIAEESEPLESTGHSTTAQDCHCLNSGEPGHSDQESAEFSFCAQSTDGIAFPLLTWKSIESIFHRSDYSAHSLLEMKMRQQSLGADVYITEAGERKSNHFLDFGTESLQSVQSTPSPTSSCDVEKLRKRRTHSDWLFVTLPFIDAATAKEIKAIGPAKNTRSSTTIGQVSIGDREGENSVGSEATDNGSSSMKCGLKLSSCPRACLPCLKKSPVSIKSTSSKVVAGEFMRRKPTPAVEVRKRRNTEAHDQRYWTKLSETTALSANRNPAHGSNVRCGLQTINHRLPRLHDLSKTSVICVETPADFTRDVMPEDIFDFVRQLGSGSYGKVYEVRCRRTGVLLALKVQQLSQRRLGEIEVNVMQSPKQSPFLVSLHSHFSTSFALYIVMEYASGGRLTQKLTEPFSVVAAAFYSAQIALALMHLHERGILYRDLKPDNVLFTEYNYIKLCDFGSCYLGSFGSKKATVSTGTPRYWAPEKLQQLPYGRPADWWSLGLILFQMLHGRFPFETSEPGYVAYMKEVIYSEPVYNASLTAKAISACKTFLKKNPDKRMGGSEEHESLRWHPFYRHFVYWDHLECQTAIAPPMYARRYSSLPAYLPNSRQSPLGHTLL